MNETLRKLTIDGDDIEPKNEDFLTSMICFTPHKRSRTHRMSSTIPTLR